MTPLCAAILICAAVGLFTLLNQGFRLLADGVFTLRQWWWRRRGRLEPEPVFDQSQLILAYRLGKLSAQLDHDADHDEQELMQLVQRHS